MRSRLLAFAAFLALPLAVWAVLPLGSSGQTGKGASLQKKIDLTQKQVDAKLAREKRLNSAISAANQRINGMQGNIDALTARQNTLQGDLDAKRAELNRIQRQLRLQRARLARARAKLAFARRVLSRRLAELYKAGRPDIVTVILNSRGFADLLERGEFIQRINDQDARIIRDVRQARDAAKRLSDQLAKLEARQEKLTHEVLIRRNQVAGHRIALVSTRQQFARARAGTNAVLGQTKTQRKGLEEDLSAMQAQQSRIQGAIAGSGGPVRRGTGRFIWPVNGPITSPFCERRAWEACHPGIDIGVGTGTPIHAADSGTVAIAGWYGGYGNYTCINHGGGISTCYGHQSAQYVHTGQSVSQGQVIGLVGCTGLCFGAHLHFEVRINGTVTNPLNYL